MRVSLQPVFILHRRLYRESSLLLELLTQEYGRLAVVARGVRNNRSKSIGLLQSFHPLLLSWQGRSELMTLVGIDAKEPPIRLQGNALLSGFYLNELLMRVLHKNDPYPELYTIYQKTLIELQEVSLLQKTLRLFEKKLLQSLGYGLQWNVDYATKESIYADQFYHFHPEFGFTVSQADHSPYLFSGKVLLAMAEEFFEDELILKEAKRLMRLVLMHLLGVQQLHSRKLFMEIET
jgi:DNA repair protein RecO (recombination protein O)